MCHVKSNKQNVYITFILRVIGLSNLEQLRLIRSKMERNLFLNILLNIYIYIIRLEIIINTLIGYKYGQYGVLHS